MRKQNPGDVLRVAAKGLPVTTQKATIRECKMQNTPVRPKGKAESPLPRRWQSGGCSWRGGVPEESQGRGPGSAGMAGLESTRPSRAFQFLRYFLWHGIVRRIAPYNPNPSKGHEKLTFQLLLWFHVWETQV